MPFKSKKQARWMFANDPKMAKRWASHTPDMERLPELAEFFGLQDDLLPGGKADRRSPSDFDKNELRMGVRHEMEHTNDRKKALEIAMDHLTEDPHYYSDMKAAGRLFGSEE